jgi:hypothetical protein
MWGDVWLALEATTASNLEFPTAAAAPAAAPAEEPGMAPCNCITRHEVIRNPTIAT